MENEEQAALRATLAAAVRLRTAERARAARVSARLGARHAILLPYVLGSSCTDPRDRAIRVDPREMQVLRGGLDYPARRLSAQRPIYEPSPVHATWVALLALGLAVLWIAFHLIAIWLWLR